MSDFTPVRDTVDGPAGKLSYSRAGSGMPLVMLHAVGLSSGMWNSFIEKFYGEHDVIALDARGHGFSETDGKDFTIADLADDVLALLDGLGLEKSDVLGLSMGGSTALAFAGIYPERVHRLVLCDTTEWYGPEGVERFHKRAELVMVDPRSDQLPEQLPRWFTEEFRTSHKDILDEMIEIYCDMNSKVHAQASEALGHMDSRDLVAKVTAPTMLISGQGEFATPSEKGMKIALEMHNAEFRSVPGQHFAFVENPKAHEIALEHLRHH